MRKRIPAIQLGEQAPRVSFPQIVDRLNKLRGDAAEHPLLRIVHPDKLKQKQLDGGALMFWELFEGLWAKYENLEAENLKLSHLQYEQKKRQDAQDKIIAELREALHRHERRLHFFCLSCSKEFELPESEAAALGFASLCPDCHSWALPGAAEPPAASPTGAVHTS